MVCAGRGGRRAALVTGNCHATGSSHSGMRLHGRRMRFGIGRAQIRDADNDIAIRVRAGRRRGENLDRTDLQDAVRARGPGDRPDGDLRAQGLQAATVPVKLVPPADTRGPDSEGSTGARAPDLLAKPGLCGTRESRPAAATGAARKPRPATTSSGEPRARSGRASHDSRHRPPRRRRAPRRPGRLLPTSRPRFAERILRRRLKGVANAST